MLPLSEAQYYITNPDRPQRDFRFYPFYKAGAQYMSLLWAMFLEVRRHNQYLSASSAFNEILDFVITSSNHSKTNIKILDEFANGVRLFLGNQSWQMGEFENGNILRQKRAMKHFLTIFLKTALGVSSNATPISRHPDLRSAATPSSADLIVPKSCMLCQQTTHSTSCSRVQCHVWRVWKTLKNPQRPYRWGNFPEKLLYSLRTTSHSGVIPTFQQSLGPICSGCNWQWNQTRAEA